MIETQRFNAKVTKVINTKVTNFFNTNLCVLCASFALFVFQLFLVPQR